MKPYFFLLLLAALPLFGEELPNAPGAVTSPFIASSPSHFVNRNQREQSNHKFFNRGSKIRMGILAGLVAADGISTQEILNSGGYWREMNPLARPFVNKGAPGQAAASVLGYGFSVGTAYLLHKTGHHKLETMMLNVSIAVETEVVASNVIWYAAH